MRIICAVLGTRGRYGAFRLEAEDDNLLGGAVGNCLCLGHGWEEPDSIKNSRNVTVKKFQLQFDNALAAVIDAPDEGYVHHTGDG